MMPEHFHVFLSHDSSDKDAAIYYELRDLRPYAVESIESSQGEAE